MTIEKKINKDYTLTVDSENRSVWVNGTHHCLGRFTPLGFEIYRELNEKLEGVPTQTLDVKIKNLQPADWNSFVTLMKGHHNINLEDISNPLL